MTDSEDSCGKQICMTSCSCIAGVLWDILACPFVSCFKCTKWSCQKCCGCCKDKPTQT